MTINDSVLKTKRVLLALVASLVLMSGCQTLESVGGGLSALDAKLASVKLDGYVMYAETPKNTEIKHNIRNKNMGSIVFLENGKQVREYYADDPRMGMATTSDPFVKSRVRAPTEREVAWYKQWQQGQENARLAEKQRVADAKAAELLTKKNEEERLAKEKAERERKFNDPAFKFPKQDRFPTRQVLYRELESGVSLGWAKNYLTQAGVSFKEIKDEKYSNEKADYYRTRAIFLDENKELELRFGGDTPEDKEVALIEVNVKLPEGITGPDVVEKYRNENPNAEHKRTVKIDHIPPGQYPFWAKLAVSMDIHSFVDTFESEDRNIAIHSCSAKIMVDSLATSISALVDEKQASFAVLDLDGTVKFAPDAKISDEGRPKLIADMQEFQDAYTKRANVVVVISDTAMMKAFREIKTTGDALAAAEAKKKADAEKVKELDF